MCESFAISVENWLSPESGDMGDRTTTAELKIAVGGEVATRLEDRFSKSVRETARLSAYRLAYWLADNWWRLRWEPEERSGDWMMSHRLGAVGGGYLWPDLAIASDGESVTLAASTSGQSAQAPIRYLSDFVQVIAPPTVTASVWPQSMRSRQRPSTPRPARRSRRCTRNGNS